MRGLIAALGAVGFPPAVMVMAEVSGANDNMTVTWMTGAAVISLATVVYRTQQQNTAKLEARLVAAETELKERNKEDRETVIPALMRNTNALSDTSRVLGRVTEVLERVLPNDRGEKNER